MSIPQFPLHPDEIPDYHPRHQRWLDKNRAKHRRKAAIRRLLNWSAWWAVVKASLVPLVGAGLTFWFLLEPIMYTRLAYVLMGVTVNIVLASLASCVLLGLYVDWLHARVKTLGDWANITLIGFAFGVMSALALILITFPSH